jgi:hypothetical protein
VRGDPLADVTELRAGVEASVDHRLPDGDIEERVCVAVGDDAGVGCPVDGVDETAFP